MSVLRSVPQTVAVHRMTWNDLCLLQTIESYATIDNQVAQTAMNKMRGHQKYLSEDLVGLSLFSDYVLANEEKLIVAVLGKPENTKNRRRVDARAVKFFHQTTLSDFATKCSINVLTALKLDSYLLASDLTTWTSHDNYISASETVAALRVVNDCTGRAVKLATDFNLTLTRDEEEYQLIFQMVEHHRKLMAEPLRKNFK